MRGHDRGDESLHDLARLTPLLPEPARAEAVRLRCRSELARRTTHARRTQSGGRPFARVLVPVMLGAFSLVYAAALLSATVQIERMLP